MAMSKQGGSKTQDLLGLQPDPLTPTSESVEQYIAALQLAYQECDAEDNEQRNWIKREVWNQIRLADAREADRAPEVRDTLHRVYRLGTKPAIDGFNPGIPLGFVGFGPVNKLVRAFLRWWSPWYGKNWNAETQTGVNYLTKSALRAFRPAIEADQVSINADGSIAAIPFKLWFGPSVLDPEIEVLKIDYDIPQNKPALRGVLDEQVEIVPDVYLGKALLKIRGKHRLLLFFSNCSPEVGTSKS